MGQCRRPTNQCAPTASHGRSTRSSSWLVGRQRASLGHLRVPGYQPSKTPQYQGPGHARGASTPQQHQIPLGYRFLGPQRRHPHLPNTQPQGAHEAEGWGKNACAATCVLVPQPPDTQTLRSERPARTSLGHPNGRGVENSVEGFENSVEGFENSVRRV